MGSHSFDITNNGIKVDGKELFVSKVQATLEAGSITTVLIETYAEHIATKVDAELSVDIKTYTDREMVEFGEMVRNHVVREYPMSDLEFADLGLKLVAKFVSMFKPE